MDDATRLALSKFDETKKVRGGVKPGTYQIDTLVRVSGTMKVGESYDGRTVARVPWQRLTAILLDKVNGITLESVIREALESEVDDTAVGERAQAAMEAIKAPTYGFRYGQVRVALDLKEEVE